MELPRGSLGERRYLAAAAAAVTAATLVVVAGAKPVAAAAAAQQDEDDDEPRAVSVTHSGKPPFELHSILWRREKSVTTLSLTFKIIDFKRKQENKRV